jgi:hypothetical protein
MHVAMSWVVGIKISEARTNAPPFSGLFGVLVAE